MKTLFFVTALIVAILAKKSEVKLTREQLTPEQSARQMLEYQKDILRLFRNINQHDYYKDQEEIAVRYDIEDNIDNYDNTQAVREFWDLNRLGFLPKDEVFSIFNDRHRREAIALFKILYYAKDFATLYKTACWARIFMNERLFTYALTVALVHRPDTAAIELPAIYEVHPELFYKSDVIQEAQMARKIYREPMDEERQTEDVPSGGHRKPIDEEGQTKDVPSEEGGQNIPFIVYRNPIGEGRQAMYAPLGVYRDAIDGKTQYAPFGVYRKPYVPYKKLTSEEIQAMDAPLGVHRNPIDEESHVKQRDVRSRRTALDQPQEPYRELVLPPWYTVLPEPLRPYSQSVMEAMRQEHLRQEQLTKHQLRPMREEQSQQRPSKVHDDSEQMDALDDDLSHRQNMRDFNKFIGITIDANYSRPLTEADEELIVSYLTEDVGFNAFYYYYNIYYPFWLPSEIINFRTDRRGEQFYYLIQQLLARHNLERISNGLENTPVLDYSLKIPTGYSPLMSYINGWKFPRRAHNLWLRIERAMDNTRVDNNYTNSYMFVRDYERRIRDAIDLGYVMTPSGKQISLYDENGLEILGNMIEGNAESPNSRFYGHLQIFARLFLGNSQPIRVQGEYQIAPSVLEHFETSLRDPVFYQFFKRMLMYFQRYLNNVPRYTTKELLMPGVKVEDVNISPLNTFAENYYVDISNAVYNKEDDHEMERIPVRVRQMRLNNEPFTYTIGIHSDKSYNVLIKVFLGPKYDSIGRRLDITENHLNFVEIDKFPALIVSGSNSIKRSSLQNFHSRDRTTYRQLYMRTIMTINNTENVEYEPREPEWAWPRRLLLPKGKKDGLTYQLYAIVTPYKPIKDKYTKGTDQPVVSWSRIVDDRPLGYPLDKPIDENVFYVPNSFLKDVVITHKGLKTDI